MPPSPIVAEGRPTAPLRPTVRGSAVLEGVLMCSASAVSVAVRRPSGEVVSRVRSRSRRPLWAWARRVPLLRGLVGCLESLGLYCSACLFALNQADLFRALGGAAVGSQTLPGFAPNAARRWRTWHRVLAWLFWGALGLILVLGGVPLIFAELAKSAPSVLSAGLCHGMGALAAVMLLTGYVSLVGHTPSLAALLSYHGAEHQVRAAYDAGAPLTLQQVRRFDATAPGCVMGRAVVLTLMGFGVATLMAALYAPIDAVLSAADGSWSHLCEATLLRVVAVILATGPYGEVRRWLHRRVGARADHHPLLAGPGTWLCAASTTQPTAEQTEVALVALLRLMNAQEADDKVGFKAPVGFAKLADACVRLAEPPQRSSVVHGVKETRRCKTN